MKKVLVTIALFFPTFCGAVQSPLEFELIRTSETPGFFAVTLFPSKNAKPMQTPIVFVKNFTKKEEPIYTPILNFLTELGATVEDIPTEYHQNTRVISLGTPLPNSENFSSQTPTESLTQFETFSFKNLKPVFFKNLKAEFGGNISDVLQSEKKSIDEQGITFIGKFNEDMRTRMAIVAENENDSLQFEAPLDLPNKNLSLSPLAKELPQLWEQLHKKNTPQTDASLSWFPWILGGLGILFLTIILTVYKRKYNAIMAKQELLQPEFPWQTISAKDDKKITPPFDLS